MLSQSLVWRKKHGVDKILSEYELPEVVKKYFPGGWHLNDREERPLLILRLGQMDVKGIIKVSLTIIIPSNNGPYLVFLNGELFHITFPHGQPMAS